MKSLPVVSHPVEHKAVGKLCRGSFAVSFGLSGGRLCDDVCAHKQNGSCYFERIQWRPSVSAAMARNENLGPLAVVESAAARMPRVFPWLRWSVSAGVPMPEHFSSSQDWRRFRKRFRAANVQAVKAGADVHLPVESMRKARAYRSILAGSGVVVRRSVQSSRLADLLKARDHRAVTASVTPLGKGGRKKGSKADNIAEAHRLAALVRASGQTGVVCPFPISGRLCGDCRACASPAVDVVIFPGS